MRLAQYKDGDAFVITAEIGAQGRQVLLYNLHFTARASGLTGLAYLA